MIPIYLSLTSVLLYSIASIIRKKISEVDDDLNYTYTILFQILGGLSVFIFSLLLGFGQEYSQFFPSLNNLIIIRILLGGIFWFAVTLASFKALNTITASKYSIIEALSPVVSIVLALLFLSETFSIQQLIGMILILLSVFAVLYDKDSKISRISKGELIALGSAILSGIALANDKIIYATTPLSPTLVTLFLLPGILGALYKPSELKKLPKLLKNKAIIKQLIIMSVIWGLSAISFYKAIVLSNSISLVVSISQLSVILTVILGLIFLKETKNWQIKIIASAISVIGLIFMSF